MRRIALLLTCCSLAFASEEALLHAFKVAREDPFSPRGQARMDRALAGLAEGGGKQSVIALGAFLRAADEAEAKVRADRLDIERSGRLAYNGMEQIKRELDHLRQRENAGATGVGPQITARTDKLEAMKVTLELAKQETMRYSRVQAEIFRKREASVAAASRILTRLDAAAVRTAVGGLRKSLDVDVHSQVILLVKILRDSKRKETAGPLLEVFSHPKTAAADRTLAACAVAYVGDRAVTAQLIEQIRKDDAEKSELDRVRILHAIGRAAGKRLADFDAAAQWAAAK